MHKAILHVENLHKSFINGSSQIAVLRGISVIFQQGSSYAIMGSSGSGKSTLLHLLAGIDMPTMGIVHFNDININRLGPSEKDLFLQKSLGLVFQLPYLIKELSVIENVMMRGLITGIQRATCMTRALELLDAVGIADTWSCNPSSLSGGQQQRVALARALFCKPTFLIADEPTGNLDEHTTRDIMKLLMTCKQEWNMGIIISSHDSFVAHTAEQIYQLKNGILTLDS